VTNTLLTPEFLSSLPAETDRLDELTQAAVIAWGESVADEGYAPELAPVIERVPGHLVAEQYTLSWPKAQALFGDQPETEQRVAALALALSELARQFEDLVPKRVRISGSSLLTGSEKSAAMGRIRTHIDTVVRRFVADGVRQEVAEAIVTETSMISTATFAALLDISQPTESKWRAAGATPPHIKNPGRAGIVRYPMRTLVPWLVDSFDYRFEDASSSAD
jgi:hypothetical protein